MGDPDAGRQDLALETHSLENYMETAAMVDASADPRAEALDAYWADLDRAVTVDRTEYRAERVLPIREPHAASADVGGRVSRGGSACSAGAG